MIEKRYMGIACSTDFNEVNLPRKFRAQKDQEDSLLSILASRSFQEEFLMVESIMGAPRNLVGRELFWKPRIWVILCWVRKGVLKKKIWDLILLISMPEASPKVLRTLLKALASCTVYFPINILSFTN